MRSEDAAALRVISDQLEERGDDAGAACLRDIAGWIEATAKPWFVDWPKELGVGELVVRNVKVRCEPSHRWQLLIEAEPVGVWTMRDVDRPDGRVIYLR
jgi:hypothetical protein